MKRKQKTRQQNRHFQSGVSLIPFFVTLWSLEEARSRTSDLNLCRDSKDANTIWVFWADSFHRKDVPLSRDGAPRSPAPRSLTSRQRAECLQKEQGRSRCLVGTKLNVHVVMVLGAMGFPWRGTAKCWVPPQGWPRTWTCDARRDLAIYSCPCSSPSSSHYPSELGMRGEAGSILSPSKPTPCLLWSRNSENIWGANEHMEATCDCIFHSFTQTNIIA